MFNFFKKSKNYISRRTSYIFLILTVNHCEIWRRTYINIVLEIFCLLIKEMKTWFTTVVLFYTYIVTVNLNYLKYVETEKQFYYKQKSTSRTVSKKLTTECEELMTVKNPTGTKYYWLCVLFEPVIAYRLLLWSRRHIIIIFQ